MMPDVGWWEVVLVVHAVAASVAAGHVLLNHREPTASILWIEAVVLLPLVGPLLYAFGGLHRVKRGHALRGRRRADLRARYANVSLMGSRRTRFEASAPAHVQVLEATLGRLSGRSLLAGVQVDPLPNGEVAFPAMLDAIQGARHSVHLLTYILDEDEVGAAFLKAMAAAARRGVVSRVMYDAVGAYELEESALAAARRDGVQVAVSRPLDVSRWRRGLHFRNHRKILVVDGRVAFTGGMNISARHQVLRPDNPERCVDIHFRVEGPAVLQLQEVFVEDWHDATGQVLLEDAYFPEPSMPGPAMARVLTSSPSGESERIHSALIHALGSAHERVLIATPYFLPDAALAHALLAAVQRGVHVEVMVPGTLDSRVVGLAMRGMLPDILHSGINVFVRNPPFSHAKVMLVDDGWAMVGSSNWDARSMRFNDECNLEVLDRPFVSKLLGWFMEERAQCQRVDAYTLAHRPLVNRLVERLAALLAPTL